MSVPIIYWRINQWIIEILVTLKQTNKLFFRKQHWIAGSTRDQKARDWAAKSTDSSGYNSASLAQCFFFNFSEPDGLICLIAVLCEFFTKYQSYKNAALAWESVRVSRGGARFVSPPLCLKRYYLGRGVILTIRIFMGPDQLIQLCKIRLQINFFRINFYLRNTQRTSYW